MPVSRRRGDRPAPAGADGALRARADGLRGGGRAPLRLRPGRPRDARRPRTASSSPATGTAMTLHVVREPDDERARPGHRGRQRPARRRSRCRPGRSAASSSRPARPDHRAEIPPDEVERMFDGHGRVLEVVAGAVDLRRPLARGAGALGHHAEADDLRPDRRAGRRADHGPARAGRRRAQLGLPLHVGARRLVLGLRAAGHGLHARRPPRSACGCATGSPSGPAARRARSTSCTAWTAPRT